MNCLFGSPSLFLQAIALNTFPLQINNLFTFLTLGEFPMISILRIRKELVGRATTSKISLTRKRFANTIKANDNQK